VAPGADTIGVAAGIGLRTRCRDGASLQASSRGGSVAVSSATSSTVSSSGTTLAASIFDEFVARRVRRRVFVHDDFAIALLFLRDDAGSA
jgi:hypothetical protein